MSGFGQANKEIFAKKMRNQITHLLLVSCAALKSEMLFTGGRLVNDEGTITYRLIEHYLNNDEFRRKNNMDAILMRFQPECPINFNHDENCYIGRLDMQVISADYFHDIKRYGVVECKRLDGNSFLKREYVNEGIERFVGAATGLMKYPRHMGADMMLGYLVMPQKVYDTIEEINRYLERKMPGRIAKAVSLYEEKRDEWYCCNSSFLCTDNKKREIEHIFYNFEEIIESAKSTEEI